MKNSYKIKWMYCPSCELLIKNELEDIIWIKNIQINHKTWELIFDSDKKISEDQINEKVIKYWYKIDNWEKDNNRKLWYADYVQILWLILIFFILFLIFKDSQLMRYAPNYDETSILVAILVWLVASVSTCFALVWSIVMGFWSMYWWKSNSILEKSKPHISFHIGRILWFFALWWILWLLWNAININLTFTWTLTIIIWIVMFYIWMQILWIFPNISKFGFHLPNWIYEKILTNEKWKHYWPAVLWALTFFVPCGFTQSMQILAISSWNFVDWWLIMAFFAIWTLPVLFMAWIWSSYTNKNYWIINKVIWVMIVMFWFYSLSNWYNLLWIGNSVDCLDENWLQSNYCATLSDENNYTWQGTPKNIENNEKTIIEVNHNWWELENFQVQLEQWKQYQLVINPLENWIWCMSTITIPSIDKSVHYIRKWEEITFEIPWLKKWTYPIVCASMWMKQWEIMVY